MEETTAIGDRVETYSKAPTAHGVVKRKRPFTPGDGPGFKLAKLLQNAAGLEGFKLKSISCSISVKECVVFTAEIYGDESEVAAALEANEG